MTQGLSLLSHSVYRQVAQQCAAFPNNQRVLGLSGGLDSVALLHLLHQLREVEHFELKAIYVHHGLSQYADDWLTFCQQLCQHLHIDFVSERVDLGDVKGESIEALARKARYQAFAKHLPIGGQLLTAQHQNDQVESFLLAAKRGSGVKGLSGMPMIKAFQHGTHLRPLLNVPRDALAALAEQMNWTWIEDDSNSNSQFDRNFLRLNVIPALVERWPSAVSAISRSARLCGEQQALLDELLTDDLNQCLRADLAFNIAGVTTYSEQRQLALLRLWIAKQHQYAPSEVRLKEIWHNVALARADAQPMLCFKHYQIRRFLGHLYLTPGQGAEFDQTSTAPLLLDQVNTLPCGKTLTLSSTNQGARITMPNTELTVGYQLAGSTKLTPAGRHGSRSYKKLLQEYQVPPWLRDSIPIIFAGKEVVAVGDLFICQQWFARGSEVGFEIKLTDNRC
ncbi:tRNA lysidine(34) synthetase TilS [Motilimonas sp. E26]|uniref:tRNA lysidine(34) synthetase TilS n=1 Tax=Motilimonas sp. E26 TaxID=2865674 RepID=UPI001E470FB9|nr:tRNA lysidine(34) synthetase TilS [Motilimonas sp. E26]MCE0556298.1 tRNA lysidine(34) synthetase TilS [Motilimonas sp. E26]